MIRVRNMVIESVTTPPWCWRKRVLPQHTDHGGVMWHGAYVACPTTASPLRGWRCRWCACSGARPHERVVRINYKEGIGGA
jgi:hypothetical protein